jgi:hypothetical protein
MKRDRHPDDRYVQPGPRTRSFVPLYPLVRNEGPYPGWVNWFKRATDAEDRRSYLPGGDWMTRRGLFFSEPPSHRWRLRGHMTTVAYRMRNMIKRWLLRARVSINTERYAPGGQVSRIVARHFNRVSGNRRARLRSSSLRNL